MMLRVLSLVLGVLLLVAPAASAAAPRDVVLQVVPEDVGFCLLVQDLRGHAKAFFGSPFVAKLCGTPLGTKILQAPEAAVLGQAKANIEKSLGLPLAQLRDEILGDAVVLAYRPGPPNQPELEQGLVVLHARDAALLARLVIRINTVQRLTGDLKDVQPRKHRGLTYHQRLLSDGSNCYFLDGPLLVFATDEAILREVLERRHAAQTATAPAVLRSFQQMELDQCLGALWINPRAFEPALRRRAEEVGGVRAVALQTLLAYWNALEGIAVTLSVQKDLELGLTLRARPERLKPAGRRFLATAAQTSELWQRFPQDTILTVAGRFDVLAFSEMLADFLPKQARAVVRTAVEQSVGVILNKEVLSKILPQLGPDWGFCVYQPRTDEKGLIPPFVLAMRVQREGTGTEVQKEVLGAVSSWVDLLVKVYNQVQGGTMGLQIVIQDKVEVRFLAEDTAFPLGFQPAFALKDGYLVFASSPAALARFSAVSPAVAPAETGEVPLARFAPQALASFLKARRLLLIPYLAQSHQLPLREIGQRLDNLLSALEVLDRVEVVKRSGSEQMSLILRVRTVEPLR